MNQSKWSSTEEQTNIHSLYTYAVEHYAREKNESIVAACIGVYEVQKSHRKRHAIGFYSYSTKCDKAKY